MVIAKKDPFAQNSRSPRVPLFQEILGAEAKIGLLAACLVVSRFALFCLSVCPERLTRRPNFYLLAAFSGNIEPKQKLVFWLHAQQF